MIIIGLTALFSIVLLFSVAAYFIFSSACIAFVVFVVLFVVNIIIPLINLASDDKKTDL